MPTRSRVKFNGALFCGRLVEEYDTPTLLQNFVTILSVLIMLDQHIAIENRRMNRRFDERNFVGKIIINSKIMIPGPAKRFLEQTGTD